MTGFPDAVVERRGAHGAAPLVVLLHGRGSNEQDFVGLADHPAGVAAAPQRT